MVKIGSGFQLPSSIDLSILDTIPVMVHKYGDPQPDKGTFRWMTYVDEGNYSGSIGFARNVSTFMPEVAEYVVDYLSGLMDIKFEPGRVNFMRTVGDVVPHRDEGGRVSCINIGVRGGPNAITRIGVHDNHETFEAEHIDHIVEDGCAYVLDVSRLHAVKAVNKEPRLLLGYGFGVQASAVLTRLRKL